MPVSLDVRLLHDQMTRGGLILWVRVADEAAEELVRALLRKCGAGSAHSRGAAKSAA